MKFLMFTLFYAATLVSASNQDPLAGFPSLSDFEKLNTKQQAAVLESLHISANDGSVHSQDEDKDLQAHVATKVIHSTLPGLQQKK